MKLRSNPLTFALVGLLVFATSNINAADRVTTQVDLDNAVAKTLTEDTAARATITTLLGTDEARTMVKGMGIDIRTAQNAVGTLQGEDLRRASALAASANAELTGGAQSVTISLVALLLIVIIVILVA
ncbi:MAG: hypothetical protein KA385_11610 [Vicinamibacteria bacterium]|nr:hypothetical protein [Vicinamibacteria bacterium]